MFQITIHGETLEVLKAKTAEFLASVSGAAVAAVDKAEQVLSGAEQAKLRGDAVVVPPKDDKAAKAAAKAAEKAAKEAAAKEAAEKAEREALGEEEQTDETDETGEADGDAAETFTHDDAKALLLEVKGAYPKDATIISKIVQEAGKAKKISEVAEENLAAVVAKCRELLKKAGK